MLEKGYCKGCRAEVFWVETNDGTRIPLETEPIWIKRDFLGNGSSYITAIGTFVFGSPIGDSYDNDDANVIEVYESHLPHCPNEGKTPRKPRNRVKGDIKKGYFTDLDP